MKYFAIFSLLIAVSLASVFNLPGPGNSTLQRKRLLPVMPGMEIKGARIIVGANAASNQFTYMVGLQFQYNYGEEFCGGALISHEWVLTAAHCTNAAHSVRVFLGMVVHGRPAVEYFVSSNHFVPHQDFNYDLHTADIALIPISRVDYTPAINKISLPRSALLRPSYAGQPEYAMGWGFTRPNGNTLASTLQYIRLKGIPNSECKKTYGSQKIYHGKTCTSGHEYNGPCKGDSGGPLVTTTSTPTLIGIDSFGSSDGCANGDPEAYTRVYHYLSWIHLKTRISA